MKPTPLRKWRHNKGWRLNCVEKELIRKKIPISWPMLVNIDRGFKTKGKIKFSYFPGEAIRKKLSKLMQLKPEKVYADRSQEK